MSKNRSNKKTTGLTAPESSGGDQTVEGINGAAGKTDRLDNASATARTNWKRRLLYSSLAALMMTLVAAGFVNQRGWLPNTDPISGKKTGWFGIELPSNASSSWNMFAAPVASAAPQLSKEYIYAGSRLLAVEDANAGAAPPPPADLAVWRPSNGVWYVMGGPGSQQTITGWGVSGDIPSPGDYDGDGKTDFTVWRASNATWYSINSSNGQGNYYYFGTSGDKPVSADFDGDGKTDPALFRPSNGTWYIYSSATGQLTSSQFGQNGDVPLPDDYDGDGKADLAFWRELGTPTYYVLRSSDNTVQTTNYGLTGDDPVAGDYDGDGKADFAVRRSNAWYILQSSNNQQTYQYVGTSTDTAVQNDYDGDGKVDAAVWRNSTGVWYINNSADGTQRIVQWGQSGDIPVPAFYRR